MYPFSQSVMPAVRSHLDAQVSFVNDLSKSMFRLFEHLCDLNIQATQTVLEEVTIMSTQLTTAEQPIDAIGAVSLRVQTATDKVRTYQQHVARIAADAQVALAQVLERHSLLTTITARALADEVRRGASAETERSLLTQQDTIRNFTEALVQSSAGRDAAERSATAKQNAGEGEGDSHDKKAPRIPSMIEA